MGTGNGEVLADTFVASEIGAEWPGGTRQLGPGSEDPVDSGRYPLSGVFTRNASHQQGVVIGVLMTYRRHHGERDRLLVQRSPGRRPPHPPAAPLAGVLGDRPGASGRAAGEQSHDFCGEMSLQFDISIGPALAVPLAAPHPGVLVSEALLL